MTGFFLQANGLVLPPKLGSSDNQILRGFGMGFSSSTIFSSELDQFIFPGFNVFSSWSNAEMLIELRGRFFFGEIDTYQVEAAGYRPVSYGEPNFYFGGGLGYGGMNLKEFIVFDMNGKLVPGLFYHNGNGMHAFLGIGKRLKQTDYYRIKLDLDYFVSLYNVRKVRMPTGIRLSCSISLYAPE